MYHRHAYKVMPIGFLQKLVHLNFRVLYNDILFYIIYLPLFGCICISCSARQASTRVGWFVLHLYEAHCVLQSTVYKVMKSIVGKAEGIESL